MLEHELAFHCAPAFAGIKPSNMVSYVTADKAAAKRQIAQLNSRLNGSDIYIRILCEYENRLLILVYRRKKLEAYLNKAEIAAFLDTCGYGNFSLEKYIAKLSKRIMTANEFPHEIGAFLGYPIEDIYGFIYHKNDGCRYTGHWKVYKNVEQAKAIFKKYDSCRNAVVNYMNKGKTLTDMFALR